MYCTYNRTVLEKTLRKFTCLTVGDQICIQYLAQNHFLEVCEVDPNGAASIIETDCNVDFAEPVGYKDSKYAEYERVAAEKQRKKAEGGGSGSGSGQGGAGKGEGGEVKEKRQLQKAEQVQEGEQKPSFVPFAGNAKRIDGKAAVASAATSSSSASSSSSSSSGDSSSSSSGAGGSTQQYYTAPARKSMVGKKYSKTGTTMSAFGGKGNVLTK